ncbi:primosomal protein N' [uncultured Thomasclavelia sp.]|uniref:replication restart helicase PriA n=1 Tax=uncultured Thomasclavelia sp. TaxID=3025759 RepID=UPI0025D9E00B|nr:primosomal protein N' [uncultured Thomasclavelia sp.]
MYIVQVLVEHPTHALDTNFDYLSKEELLPGVRVSITFGYQHIIGYVTGCKFTDKTKEELEQEAGFKYRYITKVIDKKPLLNQELQDLSITLAKLTLSPRICCLQAMLPPQLKPSTNKSVGIKYQNVIEVIDDNISVKTPRQQEALEYLKKHQNLLLKDFPYSKALLDKLVAQKAVVIKKVEQYRDPFLDDHKQTQEFVLTNDQQKVVNGIISKIDTFHTALIHGVTGSGKTEVYLQLSKYVIENNKTVLMLVPEISLTPMMVNAFKHKFGRQVAIIHSKLSSGERYDEYRRILNHEVKIVVGARSAIFAPLENIGLIILDEEHDPSYKQESKPRYQTAQIARIRGQYHHCPVVLGSATPSLESYSRAKKGIYDLYELPKRINNFPLPEIELIDMAKEMKKNNYSLFSRAMKDQIQSCIDNHEQVILLLNKRGYASYVRCLDCGEVIKCPHCDVTLTYHKYENKLKCHYCEYQIPMPHDCPDCHGKLRLFGTGTQKVEEQIEMMFEGAKVIRYDIDTTKNKDGHQKLLERFEKQEANILLGTQMIAKGLDFENVTFVGVLDADLSLNIPDFRANERTFQLLEQVSGRSGRGQKKGTVMIQTFNPDHFVLKCVKNHDYLQFFNQEMQIRRLGKYPPFVHLLSIIIQGKDEAAVNKNANQIKQYLQKQLQNIEILGPANSLIYRMQDIYRKRILIKFTNSKAIYPVLQRMSDFYNQQGTRVNVVCDFNPYNQI